MKTNDTQLKGYLGNPNLVSREDNFEYTQEQLEEYARCYKDPIYFIEKYVKIISIDDGVIPFKMWKFQKRLIKAIHKNRFTISKLQRQSGKCHEKTTKYTIRNKKTGEIYNVSAEQFHEMQRSKIDI